MGYLAAGSVGLVPHNEWDALYDYHKLDVVTCDNKAYMARKASRGMRPIGTTNEYWMLMMEPYLKDLTGCTDETDGVHGLAPSPNAGDQTKVLQGYGGWGKHLETDIINNNGTMGYIDANDDFIPFYTYAEAMAAVRVGTATQANVLIGKSFTNKDTVGLSGTMKDFSHSQLIVTNGASDSNRPAMRKTTVGGSAYYEVAMPTGYWEWSFGNSSALIPAEEKTVTAGQSGVTVEPSAGKVLTKVICVGSAPSTQEKTITASRSQQVVTPDSGKLLSKVTVNKYPDASGNYVCGANNGNPSSNDMGTGNNYRYVDATAIYKLGSVNRVANAVKIGTADTDNKTFTVTSYSNYRNFTVNNFFYVVTKAVTDIGSGGEQTNPIWGDCNGAYSNAYTDTGKISMAPSMTYTASTGVLKITNIKRSAAIGIHGMTDTSSHDAIQRADGSFTVTQTLTLDVYLIPT